MYPIPGQGFNRAGDGAGEWIRTTDLLITNQLLCQLSYPGTEERRKGRAV